MITRELTVWDELGNAERLHARNRPEILGRARDVSRRER